MRTKSKTWRFIDNAALYLWYYKPISDTQAEISGAGKIWNDRVKEGDKILVKLKNGGEGELIVNEIDFTSDCFDAVVTLGEKIIRRYGTSNVVSSDPNKNWIEIKK